MTKHVIHPILTSFVLVSALGLFNAIGTAYAGHVSPSGVIKTKWDGAAIKGYDPVAYFTVGQALKGSEEFAYEWLKVKWLFANAAHRDLFAADPMKYAPQYGGYCSDVHLVDGKADINPTAWRIVKGKLYLFYAEANAAKQYPAATKAEAAWGKVKAGLSQ